MISLSLSTCSCLPPFLRRCSISWKFLRSTPLYLEAGCAIIPGASGAQRRCSTTLFQATVLTSAGKVDSTLATKVGALGSELILGRCPKDGPFKLVPGVLMQQEILFGALVARFPQDTSVKVQNLPLHSKSRG